MHKLLRFAWLLGGCFCVSTGLVLADEPLRQGKQEVTKGSGTPSYVRLQQNDKEQAIALQTSVVRFGPVEGKGDVTVDLVAAVHIGDKAYYRALNKLLKDYDVVLYELVAPPGTRVPRGGQRELGNPLALLPMLMKSMLDLESQTEQIDYTRPNFVHADLSFEQMREKMRERGEDGWTLTLSVFTDMLRQKNLQEKKLQEQSSQEKRKEPPAAKAAEAFDLTTLLSNDPDAVVQRKRLFAAQLADPDALSAGLGQALDTLIISDRNQAAVKALRAELGKGRKKIAIFYGAAHMPDFEKRLKDELQFGRKDERWLTAWDLE